MSKLSILDELGVLVKLSMSSKEYLIALVVLVLFGIILCFTNKRNETRNKFLYFIMTLVIITILFVSYHSSLGKMISYMMNHFFIAIYFPNIAIYIAAIIIMNIIVWISIFSYRSSKQIRCLNVTVYVLLNYLMALLLKVIKDNKLDVFDQASLYGDKSAMSLIEISSYIFMIWIIFLVLYKVILIYIKKEYKPRVKRIIIRKQIKKLPENFEPVMNPEMVYQPTKKTKVIDTSKKSEDEILLEHFSKQFTLDDYRLFSKLLKEQQEREKKAKEQVVEKQKEEIIKMEEERRKLLKEEQERQERIEKQKKEEQEIEFLLQQTLAEEEREKQKLSELEKLYE